MKDIKTLLIAIFVVLSLILFAIVNGMVRGGMMLSSSATAFNSMYGMLLCFIAVRYLTTLPKKQSAKEEEETNG